MTITENIKFDKDGLIPAVAQDYHNGQVLMVAYMNEESLRLTAETGIVHYWSRSRGKLWKKGESSGHVQHVKSIFVDCDADCLVILVGQEGAACHTGYRTCFYRKWDHKTNEWQVVGDKMFDPDEVYKK